MKAKGLGDFSDTDYVEWKRVVDKGEFTQGMSRGQQFFLMMRSVERFYPFVAERKWHLQIATEESGEFVCSDNPAALVWSDPRWEEGRGAPGFALRETDLTMPLTRRLALRGRFEGQNASLEVSRRIVATTNDRTMFLARQVYSASEDFPWLTTKGQVGSRADALNLIAQHQESREAAREPGEGQP